MYRREIVAVVAGGDSIEVAACFLHRGVHLHVVREWVAAAKEHVFEEMTHSVVRSALMPGPRAHVRRDQRAVQMGSRNGHHLQPGGEDVSETGEAHARGSLMTKVVPAPGWLSQRIVPPCACKIWRATASPKPVPPSLAEKNSSTKPHYTQPRVPQPP